MIEGAKGEAKDLPGVMRRKTQSRWIKSCVVKAHHTIPPISDGDPALPSRLRFTKNGTLRKGFAQSSDYIVRDTFGFDRVTHLAQRAVHCEAQMRR